MCEFLSFPTIDYVKTSKNVRYFLKHTYKDACRAAGEPVNYLKSPSLSGMPKSPSPGNTAEDRIIERLDAEQLATWTKRSLAVMHEADPWNALILTECYIKNRDNLNFAEDMGYSKAKMQQMLQDACVALAGYLARISNQHINLIEYSTN